MSHNIHVAITEFNKSLVKILREQDISFYLKNDLIIIGIEGNINTLLSQHVPKAIHAYTDYFGGFGEQSATLFNFNNNTEKHYDRINDALSDFGLSTPKDYDSDLYDWVGLGDIRTNEDVILYAPKDILSQKIKNLEHQLNYVKDKIFDIKRELGEANPNCSSMELFGKMANAFEQCENIQKQLN